MSIDLNAIKAALMDPEWAEGVPCAGKTEVMYPDCEPGANQKVVSFGLRKDCWGTAQTAPSVADSYKEEPTMTENSRPADYVVNPDTGCWEWARYRDKNTYGRATHGGKMKWAHRVYYERFVGPIPEGYQVDHLCFNPPCVNPDHLEAVTPLENTRRAFERRGYGEVQLRAARLRSEGLTYAEISDVLGWAGADRAYQAVRAAIKKGLVNADDVPRIHLLDADDREDIRALHALGVSQKTLSEWYDIHNSQISRIIHHKTSRGPEEMPA